MSKGQTTKCLTKKETPQNHTSTKQKKYGQKKQGLQTKKNFKKNNEKKRQKKKTPWTVRVASIHEIRTPSTHLEEIEGALWDLQSRTRPDTLHQQRSIGESLDEWMKNGLTTIPAEGFVNFLKVYNGVVFFSKYVIPIKWVQWPL